MSSPEALGTPESSRLDINSVRQRLAEYGLNMPVYDASQDEYKNPRDDNQRWAQNPCIIPGED
jgi:hypothetical protein